MAPSLKSSSYKILSELDLPTLEKKRARGDVIAACRASEGVENMDKRYICMKPWR